MRVRFEGLNGLWYCYISSMDAGIFPVFMFEILAAGVACRQHMLVEGGAET